MGQIMTLFTPDPKQPQQENTAVMPFRNDKLNKIAEEFHFQTKDVLQFHYIFRMIDKTGSGYITIDDILEFLEEEKTSSQCPFVEHFFYLIDKETPDKISFLEWLPSTATFCLYPTEKIQQFVFSTIDHDHDEFISKRDLVRFLLSDRHGYKIFPFNYVQAVQILEVEGNCEKINLDYFKKLEQKMPFLCYPAFKFQDTLREKILGLKFWDGAYLNIKEQESEIQKKKQQERVRDQQNTEKKIKLEKKIDKFNSIYNKAIEEDQVVRSIKVNREKKRRNSDSKYEINNDEINIIKLRMQGNQQNKGSNGNQSQQKRQQQQQQSQQQQNSNVLQDQLQKLKSRERKKSSLHSIRFLQIVEKQYKLQDDLNNDKLSPNMQSKSKRRKSQRQPSEYKKKTSIINTIAGSGRNYQYK